MTPVELNGYAPHFRKALETVRDQAAARARQEVLASIGEAFVRQAMAAMGGGVTAAPPALFAKAAAHSPAGGATIAGKHYPGGQFIPAEEMAKASPEEKAELERKQAGGGENAAKPGTASPKFASPPVDFSAPPKAELSPHANLAAVRSSLTGLFGVAGMDENLKKVSQVVGAPTGAKVTVHFASAPSAPAPSVEVTVEHPLYTATRKIMVDERGRRFVYNEEIRVNPESTGQGVGAAVFSQQVKQAHAAGFAYIKCVAGGDGASSANTWRKAKERFPQAKSLADVANYPGGQEWLANPRNKDMNGYYTWPRLGYDQSIRKPNGQPYYDLQEAVERFPEAKSVQDILSTPEGREWWKANGQELTDTRFDLTPGSRSMQILDAYLEEKAAAKKLTSAPTTKPPSTAPGPDSTPSGSGGISPSPPEPGFTGTDRLGREWRDGKLVPKQEQPTDAKKPASQTGQYGAWGRAAAGIDDAPPPPASADRATKPLSREERAKRAERAKAAVEKAVADPKSIKPHELRALHGHFLALSKEQQKAYAKQLREKVGGTKAELADRLRERIKAERAKKDGLRVSTQQVDTLPRDDAASGYEVVGRPMASKELALKYNPGAEVVAVQKRGGKWVALREKSPATNESLREESPEVSGEVVSDGISPIADAKEPITDSAARPADKYFASQLESGLWVTPHTPGTYSTRRDAETAARAALNDYAPRKPRQPKKENPRADEIRADINAATDEQRASGKIGKQTTDLTQAEFLQKQGALYGGGDRAKDAHRKMVAAAVAKGEAVPPEVLADYPDLAAAAGGSAPESAPSGGEPTPATPTPPPLTADETAELSALNRKPARQLTPGEKARRDELGRKFTANQFPGVTPIVMGGGKGPGNNGEQSNEGAALKERQAAAPSPDQPTAPKPAPKTRDQLDYLPKDPKRLTVDQANQALADLGYEVVKTVGGDTGDPTDVPTRIVRTPAGEERELTPTGIRTLLYGDSALPVAARLNPTDLGAAFRRAGRGQLLGPANVGGNGKPVSWRVRDADGREVVLSDDEVRQAVVGAGMARGAKAEKPNDSPAQPAAQSPAQSSAQSPTTEEKKSKRNG